MERDSSQGRKKNKRNAIKYFPFTVSVFWIPSFIHLTSEGCQALPYIVCNSNAALSFGDGCSAWISLLAVTNGKHKINMKRG